MNYSTILLESFYIFLYLGASVSIVLGLILITTPHTIDRWNKKLNHWYSTRRSMKPLEIMRDTESYVFRHNRFWGWTLIFSSVLCLYLIVFQFSAGNIASSYGLVFWQAISLEITFSFLKAFIFIFVLAGIPLWILLIVNPDQVQKISHYFNRWISTRLMILPLEKMHSEVDDFVLRYPRPFGVGFILGGILLLLGL